MATILQIPITNAPSSTFTTTLEGQEYRLTIHFNRTTTGWYLDLEGLDNAVALKGMKLVTGIDLLSPHGQKELGRLYMVDQESRLEDATEEAFSDRFILTYLERGLVL